MLLRMQSNWNTQALLRVMMSWYKHFGISEGLTKDNQIYSL